MKKIGFVYFDIEYLIPHFLGIVNELYKHIEDVEVQILVPEMEHHYLYKQMKNLRLPKEIVIELPTYFYKKIAYKIQGRKRPNERFIFQKNKEFFKQFDVLAFVVFDHHYLLDIKKNGVKFVYLKHGAGDNSHPFLPKHKKFIEQFDLVIASGQKIKDRFLQMGHFPSTEFKICGYPKFDLLKHMTKKNFFPNSSNPVILYNPHFRREFSSYFEWGEKILDFFYHHKEYNLIFAPHMRLFDKRYRDRISEKHISKKYFKANNIRIDLGSIQSVDMSYTSSAEIYMGDISSQVYEFLLTGLKPVIYLNAHHVNWKNNPFYSNWKFGKVINQIKDLGQVLENSDKWKNEYINIQQNALEYTFDISPNKSSSYRVAEAIYNL